MPDGYTRPLPLDVCIPPSCCALPLPTHHWRQPTPRYFGLVAEKLVGVDEELNQDGPVLQQVAAAMAWLAPNGLLYCDLHGPTVILERSQEDQLVHLIDYDDIGIVTPGSVRSTDAFFAKGVAHAVSRGL